MKGICFKEPLFHATVEGRKTQTRRIIKPTGYEDINELIFAEVKPRYKVGEVVFLKEPYFEHPLTGNYYYRFDGTPLQFFDGIGAEIPVKWANKLFMPAECARYFIKITALRAERLQDISDEDCMKEGVEYMPVIVPDCGEYPSFGFAAIGIREQTEREAYATLIDKISGKGTWNSNPFMWVYDFVLCDKNGNPINQ